MWTPGLVVSVTASLYQSILTIFRSVHSLVPRLFDEIANLQTMAALLAGKSAAITGGVTGIGRAIALGYLRHGAAVTVNFLDDAPSINHFESLKAEAPTASKLHGVTGDIGRKATGEAIVKGAFDVHGSLDIFVANAGVSQFRDFVT